MNSFRITERNKCGRKPLLSLYVVVLFTVMPRVNRASRNQVSVSCSSTAPPWVKTMKNQAANMKVKCKALNMNV